MTEPTLSPSESAMSRDIEKEAFAAESLMVERNDLEALAHLADGGVKSLRDRYGIE